MQTFMPSSKSYTDSAKCLDSKRLNKQLVECQQILSVITKIYPYSSPHVAGWRNHPAVLMWEKNPYQLYRYMKAVHKEWKKRREPDGNHQSYSFVKNSILPKLEINKEKPEWFGNEQFHKSHRLSLLQKNREHYSQFFDDEPTTNDIGLVWPVQMEQK